MKSTGNKVYASTTLKTSGARIIDNLEEAIGHGLNCLLCFWISLGTSVACLMRSFLLCKESWSQRTFFSRSRKLLSWVRVELRFWFQFWHCTLLPASSAVMILFHWVHDPDVLLKGRKVISWKTQFTYIFWIAFWNLWEELDIINI